MGIFKDFATSDFGTFTQGVLDEADNIAMQDARTNAIVAENSLRKENEAFKLTELAFKNKDQLVKNVIDNADELNIIPGELTVEQIADRLVSKVFNTQRSIFEQKDYDSVSNAFAKFLAKTPGEEIILKNPYIPSEDLFNQEAEKHSARISAITKMPKADKLLHNIKKAEEGVESPEAIFNKAMTIAPLSAKAYGIFGYYPDSKEGRDALDFMKSSIIVANARSYHPNDPMARADFIEKRLFDNQIDPFRALNFTSPMTFRQITNILDQGSVNVSNKVFELTNQLNNPELDDAGRVQIQEQIDQLLFSQMGQVNNVSKMATMQMAGRNVNMSTQAPKVEDKNIIPKKEEKKKGVLEKIGDIIPGGDFDRKFAIQESEKAKAKQEKNKNKPTVQEEQEDMLPDDGTIRSDSISALQAGLAGNDKFIKRIMQDEGEPFLEATKVFDDEKNFTIGYGRNNASIKKGDKITVEQAQKNLAEDVKIRLEEIQDLIPNFSNLSDQLQLALFSEYYRGSVRQSPKTVKLINEGKFSEAAAEFLDNDEYRNAVDRGRRGIRKRMKKVFNLLRREGTEDSPAV